MDLVSAGGCYILPRMPPLVYPKPGLTTTATISHSNTTLLFVMGGLLGIDCNGRRHNSWLYQHPGMVSTNDILDHHAFLSAVFFYNSMACRVRFDASTPTQPLPWRLSMAVDAAAAFTTASLLPLGPLDAAASERLTTNGKRGGRERATDDRLMHADSSWLQTCSRPANSIQIRRHGVLPSPD